MQHKHIFQWAGVKKDSINGMFESQNKEICQFFMKKVIFLQ
jgi:hypothetical protein